MTIFLRSKIKNIILFVAFAVMVFGGGFVPVNLNLDKNLALAADAMTCNLSSPYAQVAVTDAEKATYGLGVVKYTGNTVDATHRQYNLIVGAKELAKVGDGGNVRITFAISMNRKDGMHNGQPGYWSENDRINVLYNSSTSVDVVNNPDASLKYGEPDGWIVQNKIYTLTTDTTFANYNTAKMKLALIGSHHDACLTNLINFRNAIDADAKLEATIVAVPNSGYSPLTTQLVATRNETSSGTTNYTFWYNCTAAGTSVAGVTTVCGNPTDPTIGAKFNNLSDASKSVGHIYSSVGEFHPKVIIERGAAPPAQAISTVTTTEVPQTLSASLAANPSSGYAPLSSALTATRSETSSGTTNYTFWYDCNDASASVADATAICGNPYSAEIGAKFDNLNIASKTLLEHSYPTAGTYHAKVIIERGSAPSAEARVEIKVTEKPPEATTLSAKLTATRDTLTPNLFTLGATAEGTAAGASNFTFYCNRNDDGTDITPGYAKRYEGVTDPGMTLSPGCTYDTGTFYPKVIIERGGLVAQARSGPVTVDSLSANISSDPTVGTTPLNVSATISVTSGASKFNYFVYCDRGDSSTEYTKDGLAAELRGTEEKTHTFSNVCSYDTAGPKRLKVIVQNYYHTGSDTFANILVDVRGSGSTPMPTPTASATPVSTVRGGTVTFASGGNPVKVNGSIVANKVILNPRDKQNQPYAVTIMSNYAILNSSLPGFESIMKMLVNIR